MNYGSTLTGQPTLLSSTQAPMNTTSETENTNAEPNLRRWGLLSGFLYVVIIVCGIVAEVGIRDNIIDFSSPEATVENIKNNPSGLRWSIILEMIMASSDILVSILFAFILVTAGANPILALSSSAFRFMQQAIITGNLLNIFAATMLLDDKLDEYIPVATAIASITGGSDNGGGTNAAEEFAFFFLALHKYGYLLALIFFGLSLVSLGLVIVLYGIFPKCLGWTIILAGFGYLTDSLLFFLSRGYEGQISNYLMIPVFIAEFGLTGWLLLRAPQMSPAKAVTA